MTTSVASQRAFVIVRSAGVQVTVQRAFVIVLDTAVNPGLAPASNWQPKVDLM